MKRRRVVQRRLQRRTVWDSDEAQIARIDTLTATGRANWLFLTGYLLFVLVTTLSTEPIDFYVQGEETELPIINVSIPTISFYCFAPILAAALYVYLHLHIRKVGEALTSPMPRRGGVPLERRIRPWLLNDYVLLRRRDGAIEQRALDRLVGLTIQLLVWWAGPIVLTILWVKTWPAHTLWLTTLNAFCLAVAIYAGRISFAKLAGDLRRREPRNLWVNLSTPVVILLIAWLSSANSKGHFQIIIFDLPDVSAVASQDRSLQEELVAWLKNSQYSIVQLSQEEVLDIRTQALVGTWNTLTNLARIDPIDFLSADLSALDPIDSDYHASRQRFAVDFCRRWDLPSEVCGLPTPFSPVLRSEIASTRQVWCEGRKFGAIECERYFDFIDWSFDSEWSEYRSAQIAALDPPVIANRDLTRVNASGARLSGTSFFSSVLRSANFRGAELEGSSFGSSDLSEARFERGSCSRRIFRIILPRWGELQRDESAVLRLSSGFGSPRRNFYLC